MPSNAADITTDPTPSPNRYAHTDRPLCVVTGGSSGIGFELAKIAIDEGHDVLIAADREHERAEIEFRDAPTNVEFLYADLATSDGVQQLINAIGMRPVSVLCANAGHGLGEAFVEQNFRDIKHVIDTNVTGTVELIHHVARQMRQVGKGRILITGSIAGTQPGSYQAVYNATKAFIDSFGVAIRDELRDSGVSVTVLMPGATETQFFRRAGMQDTKVGADKKDPAADVAHTGWDAMKRGDAKVVHGLKNKAMVAMSSVLPWKTTAAQHRKMAEPGTANQSSSAVPMIAAAAVGTIALALLARSRRGDDYERKGDGQGYGSRHYRARF